MQLSRELVGCGYPISHEAIVNLISATTTRTGLKVVQLDTNTYPKGIQASDDEFASIRLVRDAFHGDWNYTISPSTT